MPKTAARCCALLAIVCLLCAPAVAQEPTLKVGDAAPPLAISHWLKGQPVQKFEPGKVYVVEFWAKWCGPCIAAFPHLSEIAARHKDSLTVIGVNIWDDTPPDALKAFVEEQGDKMAYTVAIDQRDPNNPRSGTMAQTWMRAAGRRGIPSAFVVDQQGKIAWMGHPKRMDSVVEKVIKGESDPNAHAEREAKLDTLRQRAGEALRQNNHDEALKIFDEILAVEPSPEVLLTKAEVLFRAGQGDKANATIKALVENELKDKPESWVRPAWVLVNAAPIGADTKLALDLASRARAANGDEHLSSSKVMAMALAANGKFAEAAAEQEKLIARLGDRGRAREQQLLDEYKAKAGA